MISSRDIVRAACVRPAQLLVQKGVAPDTLFFSRRCYDPSDGRVKSIFCFERCYLRIGARRRSPALAMNCDDIVSATKNGDGDGVMRNSTELYRPCSARHDSKSVKLR